MKFIKKIWREALLLADVAAFLALMYLWSVSRPENMYLRAFMLIGIAATIVFAVLLLRSLWRAKWRAATAKAMQRVFGRIQKFFEKFADRLGWGRKGKSVLSGKTTVIFDRRYDDAATENRSYTTRPPKWKQLDNDRDRMRYLYRKMVSGKIKKGARIYSADTPSEAEQKIEKTPSEKQLFDLYISCRYDERKSPKASDVQELKRELEIK
jgi:hypothetical protein